MSQGKQPPQQAELSPQEVSDLEHRIEKNQLTKADLKLFLGLLAFSQWLQERLSRAKLTIKRLNQLFGFKNEGTKKRKKDKPDPSSGDQSDESSDAEQESSNDTNALLADAIGKEDEEEVDASVNAQPKNESEWDPAKNHGRHGVDDYRGCPLKEIPFEDEDLAAGFCPDCAAHQTKARVYAVKPTVVVFLEGQPLVSGHRYALDKVRCSVCQVYFTAPLPKELESQPKYLPSAITSIALNHYYAGQPFNRLEMLQAAQHVPLSDSTQYDLMQKLYHSVIAPVAAALMLQAANGKIIFFDDTVGRIIEQFDKNSINAHTTALLSNTGDHRVYLFYTNSLAAGKQFQTLLEHRTCDEDFMTMTDASAANFPLLNNKLLACWSILLCLSHARRRFVELLEEGDDDIAFVLACMAKVYGNDKHCKQHKLNDEERLAYHQAHSGPVMEGLRIWLNNLILFKQVEPNSRLGESICYLLKRWHWLTQFLRIRGAPLDNNLCEQAVKIVIRYRHNSLFYRTQTGANIGDAMMTVIHTARHAGVNIFDYLNTLQEHAEEVQQFPEDWLPWNYQEAMAQINLLRVG